MIKKAEYICVFLSGGIIYNFIEIAWRDYTHWSMTVAGGICFLLIHLIGTWLYGKNLFLRCVVCSFAITAVELIVGIIVNIVFRLDVWDYSGMSGNFLGQICPEFTALWFLLSIPASLLSIGIKKFFVQIKMYEDNEVEYEGSV